MESEDSEAREDSASEDSHPSTDASEDSVEVRVGGVSRPPQSNCAPPYSPQRVYSPQGSYSPSRGVYSPPLLTLTHSTYSAAPRLPPKLRKSYNTLASSSLTQVFNPTQTNHQAIAFATAYDRIPSPSPKKASLGPSNHDEVQPHPRRRKLAEPRRLYADPPRKRPHSPTPEIRSHYPRLPSSHDLTIRPVKLQKLSTPEPSPPPPLATSTPSPVHIPPTSLGAPPLIHPSLLSPLVRPPALSPSLSSTLSSNIGPHLLPQGWPHGANPYQHYSRLLGGVLPNPLALLPGGIHLPHYPIVPLLHHLQPQHPLSSPSPQPSPRSRSPKHDPHLARHTRVHDSSPKVIRAPTPDVSPNEIQVQDEPVSLVKREEKPKTLFSVASLVEDKSKPLRNADESSSCPPSPPPKLPSLPSPVHRNPPPQVTDLSVTTRVKEEPSLHCNSGDYSNASSSPSRLPVLSSIPGPSTSGLKLTNSQIHQQTQQQLLRQKQRNYKNMTRERRIEANARERTRVHTISSAYEKLRQSVPSYSHNQKLSKLSILRIAASYILTLSKIADCSSDNVVADCVEETTKTIQFEGRAKKKRDD